MAEGRRILGQFAWVASGRIAAAVLQAVLLAIVARSVSLADFGLLATILGVTTVVQTGFDLGLSTFVARERARDASQGVIATALRLNSFTSTALIVVYAIALVLLSLLDARFLLLLPIAFAAGFERNADVHLSVAFADGDTRVNVLNVFARRAVAIALFLAMSAVGFSGLAAFSGATAIAALGSSIFSRIDLHRRELSPPDGTYGAVVRLSVPYWIHSVATQLRNLDSLVTIVAAGATQAGLYGSASRLTSPLRILPTSLATALLPAAARMGSSSLSFKPLGMLIIAATGAMTLIYASLISVAPWVVPLVLGDKYIPAIPVVQIVLAGLPFAALTSLLAAVMQGNGFKVFVARASSITTAIALVSIFLGAAIAGSIGAALALGISFVVNSAILLIGLRRPPEGVQVIDS